MIKNLILINFFIVNVSGYDVACVQSQSLGLHAG
jgi:hypothetical protein